jgi:hypothetical protein
MMRRRVSTFSFIFAAFVTAACHSTAAAPVSNARMRVLFIGNSLTYYNDLPQTVAAIAEAAGETIHVAMAAEPNLALIDHLNGGSNAVQQLRSGRWDVVVLQQGPTTTQIGKDSLIIWTRLFDPYIRAAGAKPALLMVWPIDARWDRMPLVLDSHRAAAESVNGIFIPAGDAWSRAHTANPSIALYGGDNFHPAPAGTYLAALTIYERLSGKDARTLPAKAFANGGPLNLPEAMIRTLQRAAHDAVTSLPH